MSRAPVDELLESDVELVRWMQLSPGPQQVQPRQMLTGQEVGDIAGGQPHSAAGDPHIEDSSERSVVHLTRPAIRRPPVTPVARCTPPALPQNAGEILAMLLTSD